MALNTQASGVVSPGLFDAFRSNGAPTYYGENHTPWMADILEAGFIFAFGILGLAFIFILPGIHGRDGSMGATTIKRMGFFIIQIIIIRVFTFIWVTTSLFIGAVILVTNFSYEWETSEVQTTTKYKAGTGKDINASVGVHIGLRGINITLKGEPINQLNETINYNEHFSWEWEQGRIGFGPFAGEFNQEYRAAQLRGLPLPILWVAEYFTIDGEFIRWGRHYRTSGLFAHACLWVALPLWFLSNILFFVLLRYGAYFLVLTGTSMCVANTIKHYLRNKLELEIPFSSEHVIKLEYGIAFWLCLGTGCFCIVCGIVILLMDLRFPSVIARFFGIDYLQDDKTLIKEASTVSKASADTTNSDLTEIVEIDGNGERVKTVQLRPQGAQANGSNAGKKTEASAQGYSKHLDDVYGDGGDWSDESDDSDIEPTDDEHGYSSDDTIVKHKSKAKGKNRGRYITQTKTVSRGFIQRFQRPRRQPSAQPGRSRQTTNENTPSKTRSPRFLTHRRISPTSNGSETPRWQS